MPIVQASVRTSAPRSTIDARLRASSGLARTRSGRWTATSVVGRKKSTSDHATATL